MAATELIILGLLVIVVGVIVYLAIELRRARIDADIQALRRGRAHLDGWVANELGRMRKLTDEELRVELERMLEDRESE